MGNNSSILLIDKPSGITSFSALGPIKRIVDKKVGHAGTLDKFAHGLIIALTGKFTKLNTLFSSLDKTYIATFEFGKQTDTLDPEGEVIATSGMPKLSQLEEAIAHHFIGEIEQVPPIYSAIHVNGKRSYALARSNQEVVLTSRPVTIYDLSIITWDEPFLTVKIHCSKGTYVRSLARDIALAVNCRAYVTELERTAIGPFSVKDAISTKESELLCVMAQKGREYLSLLPHIGTIVVNDKALIPLTHGNLPKETNIISTQISEDDMYAVIVSTRNEMYAVVTVNKDKQITKSIAIIKQSE